MGIRALAGVYTILAYSWFKAMELWIDAGWLGSRFVVIV